MITVVNMKNTFKYSGWDTMSLHQASVVSFLEAPPGTLSKPLGRSLGLGAFSFRARSFR